MGEIFYWVLNMSITASLTGMIVFFIGRIRKIPKRIIRVLWIIPLIRMLIPFGICAKFSLMTILSGFAAIAVKTDLYPTGMSQMNHIMAADSYYPVTYIAGWLDSIFSIASFVWLGITLILMITLTVVYCKTMSELSDASHLKENIYLSHHTETPAVYGIIKPKIIIPAYFPDTDNEYIIMHEMIHIRRLDNLWRIIAFLTVCIHWFNPLSWLFLRTFLADTEMACDEIVIAGSDKEDKKKYAAALVDCALSGSTNAFASAFGGARIRTRIKHILDYRKISAFSAASLIIFMLFVTYALLTNAG
ncbi:MAG: M56 family metallopeptidase [Oscillospiraceae bacterium]|nr:M56 family metallopeptidase [Oscillospiraceae bacterium]